ncbi:MAG: 50S ribosomal protein L18 [Candidatus Sungbacteria bacterium]|uniref:Large ribosomal subunit protein uL18 n=1 Tax=Candidatus Sungiibacteriota bacterium TaxID=2750080 RepID=A0A933DRP5_9BACT|nr:50S ribosomal protein L18 [Candidatus Sungbacteria bacterium]
MKAIQKKYTGRVRRARRTRARFRTNPVRPRMSVFRSLRHISVQLIDDGAGRTIASAADLEMVPAKRGGGPSFRERATWVGGRIAEKALALGIREVQFDRGRYRYHGLVAALAAGARKGGLKF